jgi:GNAT superfamily N-acetyltransferase
MTLRVRALDPASTAEIELVAVRMQDTLDEVLGEARGRAMYSMDWLRERVRFHLDPSRTARVLVAEDDGAIVGHAIGREEHDEAGRHGWFSTIFVAPSHRRRGVAVALADAMEAWLVALDVPRLAYATGAHHARVIAFFERRGYRITLREGEMVRLEREVRTSPSA